MPWSEIKGVQTIPKGKALLLPAEGDPRMLDKIPNYEERQKLMSCDSFDRVQIGKLLPLDDPDHNLTMIVDDLGWEFDTIDAEGNIVTMEEMFEHPERGPFQNKPTKPKKPVNKLATVFYHAICIPETTHQIVGDVIICHES
jgi:hypothetical protein